ncbi:MAG: hydroxylamine reductase [Chlamydiae bacterium]|nr:hydroxylamine reductase [Chlamydiota bacterium]
MFCYQCEQTEKQTACTIKGVCGKNELTADLQDLLIYAAKGISYYADILAKENIHNEEIDHFIIQAVFATLTNVNFDPQRFFIMLQTASDLLDKAKALYQPFASKYKEKIPPMANWRLKTNLEGAVKESEIASIKKQIQVHGEDIAGLSNFILFGLKGTAAYLDHAFVLNKKSPALFAKIHEMLSYLAKENFSMDELLKRVLKTGEINLEVMKLLDAANTSTYGHPEPTKVRITPMKGKAIVVSGHDLKDLEELLKQTEGKNINIYTHGEMLPAHGYPKLKKYKHLVGNFGGAWQIQQREFAVFPGSILMTTNCLQEPKNYDKRIFTTSVVGWPNVSHIHNRDFTPLINAALNEKGYEQDHPEKSILVGFARNAILNVSDKLINAIKAKKIRHIFLIGGCDGAKAGRNYYTQFAQAVPNDCLILTLACGKYRFNKLEFGTVEGFPKLLDVGQCNDSYSAIQVALALAKAFDCSVNELPLSFILSWYEQKAVAILLTLLHLGIKNMKLGPTLPAFLTKQTFKLIQDKFNLTQISTPEEDLKAILK